MTLTWPPDTETFRGASADGAGPETGAPSLIEKWLPWHGQTISPPVTDPTGQPWCVQIALNALKSPFAGWVTTTFWSMIVPPPTGTSAAATVVPPVPLLPPEADPDPDARARGPGAGRTGVTAAARGQQRQRRTTDGRTAQHRPSGDRGLLAVLGVRHLGSYALFLAVLVFARVFAGAFADPCTDTGAAFLRTPRLGGCLASLPFSSGARKCPV